MNKIKIFAKKLKRSKTLINAKRGSELAQTVLITAIMVVIIATLFYPQIQNLFNTSMNKLTEWFNTVLSGL